MAKAVRFSHSSAGYVELMRSEKVQRVVHEAAEAIADGAEGALHDHEGGWDNPAYFVDDAVSGERAMTRVTTGNPYSMAAELRYGPLKSAAGV